MTLVIPQKINPNLDKVLYWGWTDCDEQTNIFPTFVGVKPLLAGKKYSFACQFV